MKVNPSLTKTSDADLKRINDMFASITPVMENLYSRWLDEHEYEDINDYAEVIKKELPADMTMLSIHKKPFGFKFEIGNSAVYQISIKSDELSWKRIA